jgi:phthalate 4,5-dioxygenase oxygenase subunit
MTTAAENELLTRVGAGTPMGEFMRQFWLPAAMSSEVKADGDPMRLKLLGEQLIAFRDTNGKVGIMDHRCPHRCASLFFGRNEEGGIRCVYHGWKFDAEGNCTDMANVPPHQDFKHKVHAKAYKTAERNGLIWVFMGDQANVPPLPDLEANLCPAEQMDINFQLRECNWLQAVEGEIDTSHLGFLHYGSVSVGTPSRDINNYSVVNRAPEYVAKDTDYGMIYGAYRPGRKDDEYYWRMAHFMFPCWTMPPLDTLQANVSARGYIPLDDENTMIVILFKNDIRSEEVARERAERAGGTDFHYLPNTTDWLGRWRLKENKNNDYMIDREKQRTFSYTGIGGIILQDQAVTESMGAIEDRTFEVLAPSDLAVTRNRRMLIRAVQDFQKDGKLPALATNPKLARGVRGGAFFAPKAEDWQVSYKRELDQAPLEMRIAQAAE